MADEETTGQNEPLGGGTEGGAFEAIGWALRAIVKHWAIILATVLLGAGISLAYSKSVPKIYEASTLIEFDPDVWVVEVEDRQGRNFLDRIIG